MGSALFATVTTDASCGAVNSMHDSFTPLGGLVPMANIMSGEVIFGGVGAGLYGMLMYAILAVFIAGLMVGRTPEYLGKKVEAYEVKMAMVAALILAVDILGFTASVQRDARAPPQHLLEHGQRHRQRARLGEHEQLRARTASRRFCTSSTRPRATTARRSRASR